MSNSKSTPKLPKNLSSKFGFFDRQAREYVVTSPDTPLPWVNYLTNGRYSGLISHAGGGFSFFMSPKDSRITRWRYNCLPHDRPGRTIYLRDRKSKEFWSLTWQPTPEAPYDSYECRHGMNYSVMTSEAHGIRARATFFVAPSDDLEVWRVRVEETAGRARTLDVYSLVELCLGHALVDLINQPNDKHFNDVHFLKQDQILMASKRYWVTYNSATVEQANKSWNKWVFMASSIPVEGFDGSKDTFMGPWRSEENPVAVEKGVSFNTEITAGDAIASLRAPLKIKANGQAEFFFLLGVVDKPGDDPQHTRAAEKSAIALVRKYRKPGAVQKAFQAILDERDDYLSAFQINVPDPEMNLFINFWNQYQTKTTFQFSRDASYHHGGLLFGRGYRDSCQDGLGPLFTRPQWVRQRILEMAGRQFKDGSVYHCYYPVGGGGERTGHSDTPLWLPMIIMAYLRETGEFDILKERIPYVDGKPEALLQHVKKAIGFLKSKLNDQKLVLIGPGDWNDTLDYCGRKGRGISAMNTFIYAYILRDAAALMKRLGDNAAAAEFDALYKQIKTSANKVLWDGKWYIRAINDLGEKVGSSKCRQGKIFINAQSWAVISGVAEGKRAKECMASASRMCGTPKGPQLLSPAYTKVDLNIGLATRCVPGKKENGAVFNHAVSWAYLAELVNRNAGQAYQYYKQALPINPAVSRERYEVEPYVYAEYVTSPEHPTFGQASHSWLTGSSVWMLRNTMDYLLGIRPSYDGLLVDPCIPSEWKEYSLIRKFRGATYEIEFRNPEGGNGRIVSITVDGAKVKGNILPVFADGKTHKVLVLLGK